jgi:type IV secretion system protein VirB9
MKKNNIRIKNYLFIFCSLMSVIFAPQNSFAQPVPVTTDSRIKTLVYNPNEVYQLKFHYGYQSYIEFSDDEEIEMISIGESFAWRLTPTGKRLFIRPLEIAAHTNMTIITNKRTYQFDIRSGEYDGRADEELVYTIRFYYPEIGAALPIPPQLSLPNVPPKPMLMLPPGVMAPNNSGRSLVKSPAPGARIDQALGPNLDGNPKEAKLNFNYSFSGLSDNITPTKVYDDGQDTYFQFKNNNLIIPSINAVDILGNERPINYAIKNNYIVVSAVETQFTLRLADSLLCVFNNSFSR